MSAIPPTLLSSGNFSTVSASLIDMNNTTIINLADPENPGDAVTKGYVDGLVLTGTTDTVPYFSESGLSSIPYSSVNSTSGIVTFSRLNITGFGDTAITSTGLVDCTTLNSKLLKSGTAFAANSFFTPKVGFFGVSTNPVVQQTLTVGVSTTDDIINFLKAYGLSA